MQSDERGGDSQPGQCTTQLRRFSYNTDLVMPVDGGVGGSPWILAALTGGNGNEFADPALLGRCVQLSHDLGM